MQEEVRDIRSRAVRSPRGPRQNADERRDGERDAAGHVARYACARVSAAVGEQQAERERGHAAGEAEGEHEAGRLAQRGSECARDLKQRHQHQQTDGQMHGERMKAAQELLPSACGWPSSRTIHGRIARGTLNPNEASHTARVDLLAGSSALAYAVSFFPIFTPADPAPRWPAPGR